MSGGREHMPSHTLEHLVGRGDAGVTTIPGPKERAASPVSAMVVMSTEREALQGFVIGCTG